MTSTEFARLLGVSQSTISRALNDSPLVPEEKKAYIRLKAAEVGFQLNSLAQSLKTNRTGTIGILFPRHYRSMNENPMLAHVYDHLQRDLIKTGYDVMTVYDYGPGGDSLVFERIVKRRKIDGLINLRLELSEREKRLIKDSRFPCVSLMDARKVSRDLHYCISDSGYGGLLAGRFLGRFDDYEMMYLAIEEDFADSEKRCGGFRKGLAECGRELRDDMVERCRLSMVSGYETAIRLKSKLRKGKIAIFCYSDVVALGVASGLKDSRIAVPKQVQVIGMDDVPMTAWLRPRLSTVHVAVEQMVPAGCNLLRDLIEGRPVGRYETSFKPRLILRETTVKTEAVSFE